jgi:NADH:ubiquinone oxidoreductase subunit E
VSAPERLPFQAAPPPRFGHGSRVPGWDEAADLDKDPAQVPDPALVAVPDELRGEIETAMGRYPDYRSAALPALQAAQRRYGWCSPEAIEQVACVMRVTPGYLIAVATFYDMLETRPAGRHRVYVCTNISCSLRGADKLFAAVAAAAGDDPDITVRSFECLGACDIAPMASVDGVYVGPLQPADAATLIDDVRAGRPVLPERQLARRRSADPGARGDGDAAAGDGAPSRRDATSEGGA